MSLRDAGPAPDPEPDREPEPGDEAEPDPARDADPDREPKPGDEAEPDPARDAEPAPDPDVPARDAEPAPDPAPRRPLYPRLLRLRHIALSTWQRALLAEGSVVLAILLALADLASPWTVVVLPLAVAAMVKAHDAVQGLLEPGRAPG